MALALALARAGLGFGPVGSDEEEDDEEDEEDERLRLHKGTGRRKSASRRAELTVLCTTEWTDPMQERKAQRGAWGSDCTAVSSTPVLVPCLALLDLRGTYTSPYVFSCLPFFSATERAEMFTWREGARSCQAGRQRPATPFSLCKKLNTRGGFLSSGPVRPNFSLDLVAVRHEFVPQVFRGDVQVQFVNQRLHALLDGRTRDLEDLLDRRSLDAGDDTHGNVRRSNGYVVRSVGPAWCESCFQRRLRREGGEAAAPCGPGAFPLRTSLAFLASFSVSPWPHSSRTPVTMWNAACRSKTALSLSPVLLRFLAPRVAAGLAAGADAGGCHHGCSWACAACWASRVGPVSHGRRCVQSPHTDGLGLVQGRPGGPTGTVSTPKTASRGT